MKFTLPGGWWQLQSDSAGDLTFLQFISLQTDNSEVVFQGLLFMNKACLELLPMMRWNISKVNNGKNPGSFPYCVIRITLLQNDSKQDVSVLTGEVSCSQDLMGKLAFSVEEECLFSAEPTDVGGCAFFTKWDAPLARQITQITPVTSGWQIVLTSINRYE